jgi:hypothetical protein
MGRQNSPALKRVKDFVRPAKAFVGQPTVEKAGNGFSNGLLRSVDPETSNFVCVQGARKTKKRSVHAVREHFWATEQHGNRVKRPFPDGH